MANTRVLQSIVVSFPARFLALICMATMMGAVAQPDTGIRDFPASETHDSPLSDERPPAPTPPATVEERFAQSVHADIHQETMGYSLVVLRGHEKLLERNYGLSRSEPDGRLPWDADTPMHVASSSKFLTAVAVSRLFAANGIIHPDARPLQNSPDGAPLPTLATQPIIDYLPDYWEIGPGVESITIGHLLSHESNLGCSDPETADESRSPGFLTAKRAIEIGTGTPCNGWREQYKNLNYTLLRIIMATAGGLSTDFSPDECCTCESPLDDPLDCAWDAETTRRYVSYLQDQIFRTANIHTADVATRENGAFYYRHQSVFSAGRSSDEDFSGARSDPNLPRLSSRVGPIGWVLTSTEMARLVRAALTPGLLLHPAQMQEIMDERYSLGRTTRGGQVLHGFGGTWGRDFGPLLDEFDPITVRVKNWFYIAPNGTIIVLFANSEIDGGNALLDAYEEHPVGLN